MKTVKTVEVQSLRKHPSYSKIYNSSSLQFDLLVESIKSTGGLLEPIVITKKKVIISGVLRWEAYKRLGWKQIPAIVFDHAESDEVFYIVNYNRYRSKTIVEKYREIEQMKSYWGKKQGQRTDLQSGLSEVEKMTTRKRIACSMGISEGNVYKIESIAKLNYKLLSLVDAHEMSLNEAYERAKGKSSSTKKSATDSSEHELACIKTCPNCGSVIKNQSEYEKAKK
jgi:hypothetical protein